MLVVRLLDVGSPPAVSRLITEFSVDPVDGRTFWALTHVFKECRERLPSITHSYASPAISGESITPRVVASLTHCAPRNVGRRHAASPPIPMLCGIAFLVDAPARLRVAAHQAIASDVGDRTAVASAFPSWPPTDQAARLDQREPPEFIPGSGLLAFGFLEHLSSSVWLVIPLPLNAAGFVFVLFALFAGELLRREGAYLHPIKLGG
ncbi:hypothetical protein L9Z73_01215 [Pseudomonas sp. TNT11]|uniref:Uncharacterized protein n=1 Tax=Pseudomonas emilianonis TaxID=2915812 RepID=A0ABT0EBL4_9PSED|nr:hypothetical protein [Pseudomonas emilianonis]MCK1783029.1 hypothetical protein [Pseudomonas emilianonis]